MADDTSNELGPEALRLGVIPVGQRASVLPLEVLKAILAGMLMQMLLLVVFSDSAVAGWSAIVFVVVLPICWLLTRPVRYSFAVTNSALRVTPSALVRSWDIDLRSPVALGVRRGDKITTTIVTSTVDGAFVRLAGIEPAAVADMLDRAAGVLEESLLVASRDSQSVSVSDAAVALSVTQRRIRWWIAASRLPVVIGVAGEPRVLTTGLDAESKRRRTQSKLSGLGHNLRDVLRWATGM